MRCNDARDTTANPLYDGVIDTLVSVGSTFGGVGATRGPEVFKNQFAERSERGSA
jgi:hypothetical protein